MLNFEINKTEKKTNIYSKSCQSGKKYEIKHAIIHGNNSKKYHKIMLKFKLYNTVQKSISMYYDTLLYYTLNSILMKNFVIL